jgi:hypothetical protein
VRVLRSNPRCGTAERVLRRVRMYCREGRGLSDVMRDVGMIDVVVEVCARIAACLERGGEREAALGEVLDAPLLATTNSAIGGAAGGGGGDGQRTMSSFSTASSSGINESSLLDDPTASDGREGTLVSQDAPVTALFALMKELLGEQSDARARRERRVMARRRALTAHQRQAGWDDADTLLGGAGGGGGRRGPAASSLTSSPSSGPAANVAVFRASGGTAILTRLVRHELTRGGTLDLMSEIILTNDDPSEIGEMQGLIEVLQTAHHAEGGGSGAAGSVEPRAAGLKSSVLRALCASMADSDVARSQFRECGGFECVVALMASLQGALDEDAVESLASLEASAALMSLLVSTLAAAITAHAANRAHLWRTVGCNILVDALRLSGVLPSHRSEQVLMSWIGLAVEDPAVTNPRAPCPVCDDDDDEDDDDHHHHHHHHNGDDDNGDEDNGDNDNDDNGTAADGKTVGGSDEPQGNAPASGADHQHQSPLPPAKEHGHPSHASSKKKHHHGHKSQRLHHKGHHHGSRSRSRHGSRQRHGRRRNSSTSARKVRRHAADCPYYVSGVGEIERCLDTVAPTALRSPGAVSLVLTVLPSTPEPVQVALLVRIAALAEASLGNRDALAREGVCGLLLRTHAAELLANSATASGARALLLDVIESVGAFKMSPGELRILLGLVRRELAAEDPWSAAAAPAAAAGPDDAPAAAAGDLALILPATASTSASLSPSSSPSLCKVQRRARRPLLDVLVSITRRGLAMPVFEFAMREPGYGCISLASLGESRHWPPSAGYSFACWFTIERADNRAIGSHPVRLFSFTSSDGRSSVEAAITRSVFALRTVAGPIHPPSTATGVSSGSGGSSGTPHHRSSSSSSTGPSASSSSSSSTGGVEFPDQAFREGKLYCVMVFFFFFLAFFFLHWVV